MSIVNDLFNRKFAIEDELAELEQVKSPDIQTSRRLHQLRTELKKVKHYIDTNETINNAGVMGRVVVSRKS